MMYDHEKSDSAIVTVKERGAGPDAVIARNLQFLDLSI